LLAGTSAGGIGVEVNADQAAALLPATAAAGRLRLVDDGGFFLDWDDPDYRLTGASVPIRELLQANYDLWGSALNPLCEQAMESQGQHPGNCFIQTTGYPFIAEPAPQGLGLPLLIQVSSLDQVAMREHGIDDPNDPEDRAALERWREQTLGAIRSFEWVFSGGRAYHTLITRDDARNGLAMAAPGGATFGQVLADFWGGSAPEQVIFSASPGG
jgi:hypothetical protein